VFDNILDPSVTHYNHPDQPPLPPGPISAAAANNTIAERQTTYADTIDAEEPDEQEVTQTLKIHIQQLETNKILTTVEVSADTTIADLKARLQQETQCMSRGRTCWKIN
jgi:hypothetical protein